MKRFRVFQFCFGSVLLVCSFLKVQPNLLRAQTDSTQVATCCSAVAPRQVEFPYYSLRDGFVATVLLVSDSPKPLSFVMAVHSRSGDTVLAPEMVIQAHEKLPIDVRQVLTTAGADVLDDFSEGSVSVYFTGGMMPLPGQLTMTNPARGLVLQTEMVDNAPGLGLLPSVLNGVWWGLGSGRVATVAVSNTSGGPTTADVFLDFQGSRHKSDPLTFRAHETKVLSIAQLLGDLKASPAQVPEGGITISPRGGTPVLVAQGRIVDQSTGFSTTLNFLDPGVQKVSALHASGLPIGVPSKDSPYAGAGVFIPHVILRNLVGAEQSVILSIEYPDSQQPQQLALALVPIGPYSTADISLDVAFSKLPLPLPFCSIRIQYNGEPGSVIAEVASVESKGDLVVDGRLANEGDGWAGSGGHPWHLDDETDSFLFLTNMGNEEARIGFKITTSRVSYYLADLALSARETKVIDVRDLRDGRKPGWQGALIPADASDGSLLWIRLDNVPVMGRLVQMQRRKGMVSSYQCSTCNCPGNGISDTGNALVVTPANGTVNQGSTVGFTATTTYMAATGPTFLQTQHRAAHGAPVILPSPLCRVQPRRAVPAGRRPLPRPSAGRACGASPRPEATTAIASPSTPHRGPRV